MWSVLAADRAAKGNKELAQMQLGLEREKMGQQNQLAQKQNQLAQQRLGLQRQGLQQQGQISREQMKQQRFMQGQQLSQQTMLAKLNAEEREKDRQLQTTLATSKQEFMRGERRASQEFQKAMSSKQYDRAKEMWEKRKNFQMKQAQLGMLNQFALMKLQLDYTRADQKARRELALRLKEAEQNTRKEQRFREDLVDKYERGLKAGGDGAGYGAGEIGQITSAAVGAFDDRSRQRFKDEFDAQQVSAAIDALESRAETLSNSKDETERGLAGSYIRRADVLRTTMRDTGMEYVPPPEMSMKVIRAAMEDFDKASNQRYGKTEKAMLEIMKGNTTTDLPPKLVEAIFGPDWDK
jgi:hypothetical protein